MTHKLEDKKLAIIGLGYVGWPLAVEFGKHYETVAFDVDQRRVDQLRAGMDRTGEITKEEIAEATRLTLTTNSTEVQGCDIFIVTVPTPIDDQKRPDLSALKSASKTVGQLISTGGIVIYESTVYPGAVEDVCVPIVEEHSGLKFNEDFFAGYSPERINPGDTTRRLVDIVKVTSGSDLETADEVDALYASIIVAGTYKAESIRIAEAAKVIENTQRDLNIALVNELAMIFHKLGIDTDSVLRAAGTNWNFLKFEPGLVGGHCIGVDPYYLTHIAQKNGYSPEVILAGRRINDGMGNYVADRVSRQMIDKKIHIKDSTILVLGIAFKENCSDIRNSKVIDIVIALEEFGANVQVYDPCVDAAEVETEYGISLADDEALGQRFDAIVLAVARDQLQSFTRESIKKLKAANSVVFDVKGVWPTDLVDERL